MLLSKDLWNIKSIYLCRRESGIENNYQKISVSCIFTERQPGMKAM